MSTERELSDVFSPCTLNGLAAEWDRLNREISGLKKDRDNLQTILLEASAKDHNGADEMFRRGAVIGDEVKVQAVWHLVDGGERPTWKAKLEYCR